MEREHVTRTAEIRARLEASSAVKCWPGDPQRQGWLRAIDWIEEEDWDTDRGHMNRNDVLVAWPGGSPEPVCVIDGDAPIETADALLISNAPADLRHLLAEVERLEGEREFVGRDLDAAFHNGMSAATAERDALRAALQEIRAMAHLHGEASMIPIYAVADRALAGTEG